MSRIVIVDDHEPLLEVFEDALALDGHEVLGRTGGGVAELAALKPDLIIIDVQLGTGERGGLDLLREARCHPALAGVPLVVVTADVRVQRDLRPELKSLNARLLLKPFTIEALSQRVADALLPPAPEMDRPAAAAAPGCAGD